MAPLTLQQDGWLAPDNTVTHKPTPHLGAGTNGLVTIVEHYTAGTTPEPAVNWLTDPNRTSNRSSAHFVIGPDGHIWQLASVNDVTWHAGVPRSRPGRYGVNGYSIGIEHTNAGTLTPGPQGWHAMVWKRNPAGGYDIVPGAAVPSAEVAVVGNQRWQTWSSAMLDRSEELHIELIDKLPSIVEIAYHEEIDPENKIDPGPLFPRDRFEALIPANRVTDTDTSTDPDQPSDTPPPATHAVKPGDTFWAIGRMYGITQAQLQKLNPKYPALFPGDTVALT